MMKKRVWAGLLGMILAGAFALPSGASEPSSQTRDSVLNAEVDSSFTLTIPQTTDLAYGKESTRMSGFLKVSGNVDTDEQVKVTATAAPLHNSSHNENIAYALTDGENTFESAVWSEKELRDGISEDQGKKLSLFIEIEKAAWNQAKAGAYEGTVTFTASLEKVPETP